MCEERDPTLPRAVLTSCHTDQYLSKQDPQAKAYRTRANVLKSGPLSRKPQTGESRMTKTAKLRLCLILFFLVVSVLSIQGQSGRRKVEPPPAAPVPSPTAEPTPRPQKKIDAPEIGFVVVMDRGGAAFNYPTSFYDAVQMGCAERLRSESRAWVDTVRDDMHRGQAIKRAKSETTGNVVWLQLNAGPMNNPSNQNYNDIEIEYVVYAPGTGKTVTSGRGYQNSQRRGPLVITPPGATNNAMLREQILRLAAEDVADRILNALHLGTTPPIVN